jgi:hypothetical protein
MIYSHAQTCSNSASKIIVYCRSVYTVPSLAKSVSGSAVVGGYRTAPSACVRECRPLANLTIVYNAIMPTKSAQNDGRSRKRVKLDVTSWNTYRYSDGADIQSRLHVQTQDGLSEGEF